MMIDHRVEADASPDVAKVSQDIEYLAITYGVEARRHYRDCGWDEVRQRLAAGWPRLCAPREPGWDVIAPLVRSGWHSAFEAA